MSESAQPPPLPPSPAPRGTPRPPPLDSPPGARASQVPRPPPPAPAGSQSAGSRGAGTTRAAGSTIDEGKGRTFPCEGCGADLVFNIGQQEMTCPYCGFHKQILLDDKSKIVEQDFHAMLARLAEQRAAGETETIGDQEIRCGNCGALITFTGTLTSSECPYCATPLQREHVHTATTRIPADGVLPFLVPHDTAARNLKSWVESRWFAPTEFRARGVTGKFQGVYVPYFTFDTLTFTRYNGLRGDYYYVTVEDKDSSGKTTTRSERRTSWTPAWGNFQRFFDDVLVLGAQGMEVKLVEELEPWPLERCAPFNQQMLAGFLARTYDIPLDQCFKHAQQRIDSALQADVRSRIGGDEQQVTSLQSKYDAITFKHLLLPLWLMAYRFQGKVFHVLVNAATGEVQGQRPYSWVKITFAVLLVLILIVGLFLLTHR